MRFDFERTSREILEVFLRDVSAYGGIGFFVMSIGMFIALNDMNFASLLTASLLAITAIVATARLAWFKPRPGMKKKEYSTYYDRIDNSSFPSIHVARAALLSIAFASKISALLPFLAFATLLVCVGRIYFKRHDVIDIVVGLGLGIVLGLVFF